MISIPSTGLTEDQVMELALESGAQDVSTADDMFEITTDPAEFETVRKAVEDQGWKIEEASITRIPQNSVKLDGKKAEQMLKMMDVLDDHEDLQNVYANFDISDEEMLKLSA